MNSDGALVLSVNVTLGTFVSYQNKQIRTGIFKRPVEGRVMLSGVNLTGDDQADRTVHGGPERAAYAYAVEDYRWWEGRLGKTLPPGKFGENFTLQGIDLNNALIGERWQIGDAVVQVMSARVPCFKLGIAMGDQKFVKRFSEALRPGAYLGIVQEGTIGAGDPVEVVWRPDHHITVREMMRVYTQDRAKLHTLLVPELPTNWREWIEARPSSTGKMEG